jgi:hypothetical protein
MTPEQAIGPLLRTRIPVAAQVRVNLRLLHDIAPLVEKGLEARQASALEQQAADEFFRVICEGKAALAA